MLEEIADSMTLGGVLAAVVGLCAALSILLLRVHERKLTRRSTSDDTPDIPASATLHQEEAVPSGTAIAGDAVSQPANEPSGEETAVKRPASVFKPYVPPQKP